MVRSQGHTGPAPGALLRRTQGRDPGARVQTCAASTFVPISASTTALASAPALAFTGHTHTHVRAAVGFRRVHNDAELASLLSDKNVLRSMLVRDPFHRFLSFYRNKIQMVEIKNNKAPPDPCSARRPSPPLMRVTLATCHRSSR